MGIQTNIRRPGTWKGRNFWSSGMIIRSIIVVTACSNTNTSCCSLTRSSSLQIMSKKEMFETEPEILKIIYYLQIGSLQYCCTAILEIL